MNRNFQIAMAVHRKMKSTKSGMGKEALKDKMKSMMMKKSGGTMPMSQEEAPEMMAEGGMIDCAHGGPIQCAMGCYAEGGEVEMPDPDFLSDEEQDHAMKETYPDPSGIESDDPMDEERMKRKNLISKIMMRR